MVEKQFGGTLVGVAEPLIMTIDNGATSTRMALGAERFGYISKMPTSHSWAKQVSSLALISSHMTRKQEPDMVGLSIAGEVDAAGQKIVQAGMLKDYGWVGREIVKDVADTFNIHPERIVLLNDLEAAGWAERQALSRELHGAHATPADLPEDFLSLLGTISTGYNTVVLQPDQITNYEAGHWPTGQIAPTPCGCGKPDDSEAWISGSAFEKRFGEAGDKVPADDPRWDDYRDDLAWVMEAQLAHFQEIARDAGRVIHKMSLFGSVALGNANAIQHLQRSGISDVEIASAHYGNDSGLYGGYFAAKEKLLQVTTS